MTKSLEKLSQGFGKALSSFVLTCWAYQRLTSPLLNPFVVISIPQSKDLEKMSFIYYIDIGLQPKPGPTFQSGFHFFWAYYSPLSLWQKPRLVALIWKFHRKMTRSFFGRFPAFWPGFAAGPRALGLFFMKLLSLSEAHELSFESFHSLFLYFSWKYLEFIQPFQAFLR